MHRRLEDILKDSSDTELLTQIEQSLLSAFSFSECREQDIQGKNVLD